MPTHGDFIEEDLGATETTETNLGTITLSKKATRIIGVWGVMVVETGTAGEGAHATFRISSKDIDLAPFQFPADVHQDGDQGAHAKTTIIPVDIPVGGQEVFDCYMTAGKVQTGDVRGVVGVIYE